MIVPCIVVSIAKVISLFPQFFALCIPTSIFIQLNDFPLVILIFKESGGSVNRHNTIHNKPQNTRYPNSEIYLSIGLGKGQI